MMKVTGQTVLITGGSSGIGLALAKKLSRMGNVVIVAGRDSSKLDSARKEAPELATYICDINREEERMSLAALLSKQYPNLSVLINNAGIQYQSRFVDDPPSLDMVHQELETNFVAPVRLSSLLLPGLLKQKQAAIVNISSGLAIAPKADAPVYCASKAALSAFSRTLRYQLKTTSVQVFDVLAPLVDTPMTEGRGRGKMSPERFAGELVAGIAKDKPVLRIGKTKYLYAISRLFPEVAYRITKNGL